MNLFYFFFQRCLGKFSVRRETCVVDENRNVGNITSRKHVDERLRRFIGREIERNRNRADLVLGFQLRSDRFKPRAIARYKRNVVPLTRKDARDLQADAAGRSRNDRGTAATHVAAAVAIKPPRIAIVAAPTAPASFPSSAVTSRVVLRGTIVVRFSTSGRSASSM
jgi:hypothetical protein